MLNTHFANIVRKYTPMIEQLTHCYVFMAPTEGQNGEFGIDIELTKGQDVEEVYNLTYSDKDPSSVTLSVRGNINGRRAGIMNDIADSIREKLNPERFSREDFFERNGLDIKDETDWDKVSEMSFTSEEASARIYFDMDGTLAVFNKNATMEEVFSPGYFRNLAPIKESVEFAEALVDKGYDVHILSGACYSAVQEKIEWLQEHMPFISPDNYSFVPVGADKSKFIPDPKHSVLIDDYNVNLVEWKGLAIKCVTDINNHNPAFADIDVSSKVSLSIEDNLESFENALIEWLPKDSLSMADYLVLTYSEGDREPRPQVVCRDGFSFFVETGENSHSEPVIQPYRSASHSSVEIVCPSENDELLDGFINEYLYLGNDMTESSIPYVPVDLLEEVVKEHGGIDTERTFSPLDLIRYGIGDGVDMGRFDDIISENGLEALMAHNRLFSEPGLEAVCHSMVPAIERLMEEAKDEDTRDMLQNIKNEFLPVSGPVSGEAGRVYERKADFDCVLEQIEDVKREILTRGPVEGTFLNGLRRLEYMAAQSIDCVNGYKGYKNNMTEKEER